MDFLNLDEIKEKLKDAEIKPSSQILNKDQIELIKDKIELNPVEEFGKGNCLGYAFRVAQNTNATIVEGVARVLVEKDGTQDETVIKHAWNILDGNHFDVTKDYVWPSLSPNLLKSQYYLVNNYSLSEYNLDGNAIEFKSSVDLIAASLRYLHTKNYVLNDLSSFGLDKKYYEQLLTECIKDVKENKA